QKRRKKASPEFVKDSPGRQAAHGAASEKKGARDGGAASEKTGARDGDDRRDKADHRKGDKVNVRRKRARSTSESSYTSSMDKRPLTKP
ncbi:unnamed protein product, partial [Durusdinium trenchii]